MENKVLLCGIAKMENRYLGEWINYHLKKGFDKIVLLDNNDTVGPLAENICDVPEVSEGIKNGVVDVIHINDRKVLQQLYYTKVYYKYMSEFDWFLFLDIDEFFTPVEVDNVKDFCKRDKFKDFDAIKLIWKCYGDSNIIDVKDGNYRCLDRFSICVSADDRDNYSKTLFRNMGDDELFFPSAHSPLSVTMRFCDPLGNQIYHGASFNAKYTLGSVEDVCYVSHYITKSLEEFIDTKMKRGGSAQSISDVSKKYTLKLFFTFNDITPKKIEYLKARGFDTSDLVHMYELGLHYREMRV